jgi:hypothetical protein
MDARRRARLEKAGWRVGDVQTFLGLTDAEAALVEMKAAAARELAARRKKLHLVQVDVARKLRSSQSRLAKAEAADKSVALDYLVRSLLQLGVSRRHLGAVLGGATRAPRRRAG